MTPTRQTATRPAGTPDAGDVHSGLLTRVVTAPVRLYQQWVSPALPPSCRFYPSCSSYAIEAVQVHGPAKGLLLAAWRVARCHPYTRGGVDHVPDPGQWRYPHPHDVPRPQDDQA